VHYIRARRLQLTPDSTLTVRPYSRQHAEKKKNMAKGKYFRIKSRSAGLYLDVKGASKAPGTPVILWSQHSGDNQVWYYCPTTKSIRGKPSRLPLDVSGGRLHIGEYTGSPDQQWYYNKSEHVIQNIAQRGKVLDVVGSGTDPGTEVCSWDMHGRDNQKWELEQAEPIAFFHIRSATCDKVLDISGNNKSPGALVVLWPKKGSADNQLWFEDTFGNIRSKLNDKLVLDASGGDLKTGEYSENNNKSYWAIDGTKIVNAHNPSEVLDLKAGCTDNGTAVCAWQHHGKANQQWYFDHI